MYYIRSTPDASGNHGNPQGNCVGDMLILPDELLKAYIDTMGFAILTVDEGTVTAVEVNQAAYDAYRAEHPPGPEPAPEPSQLDRVEAQAMYTALMTDTLLDEMEV